MVLGRLMFLVIAYLIYLVFWFVVVATVITLYVGFCLFVFLATLLAMIIRGVFRSNWPHDPRRPSLRRRHRVGYDALGRPIQARWSDRR